MSLIQGETIISLKVLAKSYIVLNVNNICNTIACESSGIIYTNNSLKVKIFHDI